MILEINLINVMNLARNNEVITKSGIVIMISTSGANCRFRQRGNSRGGPFSITFVDNRRNVP